MLSGRSINVRDLLEAELRAHRPTYDENNTAKGGHAQGGISIGINDDDDDEKEELAMLFVDHTFYRHKI